MKLHRPPGGVSSSTLVTTQKSHEFHVTVADAGLYSTVQARIRGGGARGPCPPPPLHKKLLPQIVRRGSRGAKRALPPRGAKRALPPPPPLQNPGSAYAVSHTEVYETVETGSSQDQGENFVICVCVVRFGEGVYVMGCSERVGLETGVLLKPLRCSPLLRCFSRVLNCIDEDWI